MRHEQKCEASSDDSETDQDAEDSEEAEERKRGAEKAVSAGLFNVNAIIQQQMDIFGFETKTDYTVDNPQFVLSTTKRLS